MNVSALKKEKAKARRKAFQKALKKWDELACAPKPAATIAELEAILDEPDHPAIELLPSGEIRGVVHPFREWLEQQAKEG